MPIIELPEAGFAYVTIAELRALPNLGDEVAFTDDDLAEARETFETTFEEFVGVAFVPRTDTYLATGDGTPSLMLPHYPVRSITAVRLFTTASDFTDYTTDELAELVPTEWGEVKRYTGRFWPWSLFGAPNIQITYTHGFDAPPADVKRAAKTAIQEALMQDNTARPDRTYGTATEGVFVRNIIEDENHPFGLPGVDSVAVRYRKRYRVPAIA